MNERVWRKKNKNKSFTCGCSFTDVLISDWWMKVKQGWGGGAALNVYELRYCDTPYLNMKKKKLYNLVESFLPTSCSSLSQILPEWAIFPVHTAASYTAVEGEWRWWEHLNKARMGRDRVGGGGVQVTASWGRGPSDCLCSVCGNTIT